MIEIIPRGDLVLCFLVNFLLDGSLSLSLFFSLLSSMFQSAGRHSIEVNNTALSPE